MTLSLSIRPKNYLQLLSNITLKSSMLSLGSVTVLKSNKFRKTVQNHLRIVQSLQLNLSRVFKKILIEKLRLLPEKCKIIANQQISFGSHSIGIEQTNRLANEIGIDFE